MTKIELIKKIRYELSLMKETSSNYKCYEKGYHDAIERIEEFIDLMEDKING